MSNPSALPLPRRWPDLLPRIASAVVMAVLALGTAMVGGAFFELFWLLAAAAILWEWQHMIAAEGAGLRFAAGAAALAVMVPLVGLGSLAFAAFVLCFGILAMAALAPSGLRGLAAAGLIYAAALVAAVTVLRASVPEGVRAILWLFAVVWGTDVMAYFGGRLFGGPKLWPRLSPGKTWSGFMVGIGIGALLGLLLAPAGSSRFALVLVGLAAGALAQAGDLFESGLKRRFGVKDASHLIPGHGGVMDRLDGFLVAAVFAALLGTIRDGVGAAGFGLMHW